MQFLTRPGVLTARQRDIGSSVLMALIYGAALVLIVVGTYMRSSALLMPLALLAKTFPYGSAGLYSNLTLHMWSQTLHPAQYLQCAQ